MSMSKSRDYTSQSFGRTNDRDGFEQLMNRNGDATIDIPLQERGGESTPQKNPTGGMNEKQGYFHRRGGRRKSVQALQQQRRVKHGYDGEEDQQTKMGQVYDKILHFSVFTRYFLYIIPVAALLAIPIIVGATTAKAAEIGQVRMIWIFVWLLCSWVGLWGSKVVAHYLPIVFQALCSAVSSGTRKYALILKQLEIPLSLVGWALVTLATFKPLMTNNPRAEDKEANSNFTTPEWVDIVQQILAAAMISSLIFLGERLFIQIISINYHRKQFHGRIKTSKRQQWLLGLLYEASRGMFPSFCEEFAEEDAVIEDVIELSFGKKKKKSPGHTRSGSSTPMRVLHDLGNIGDKVTSAFGTMATEVTGKQIGDRNSAHSVVTKALEKNRSSEALARRLWLSFVIEGQDSLYPDDVIEVLGHGRETEAEECIGMLDKDGNGDISLDEMILTVSQFGRERNSIADSMHDVDQAIKVLDRMLCFVIFIIVCFIFVAFLNASFVTTLATAGTALLSLSFVFSATAAEFLGSCIFLFVKHPYDIGDRVDLNSGADKMIVEHISLLFTVFRRIDSHRTVQIPNMTLNTIWIENVTRSSNMKEQLSLFVAFDTSLEDIQLLRNEMKKFVTASENKRDFQDEVNIEVLGINQMDKLELSIEILHKSNWSNETVRAARRSKFMCALVLAIRKVPIYGPGGGAAGLGSSDNPSYSVAVTDDFAATSRQKAADAMESARLVPTKKAEEVDKIADTLGPTTELRVMTSLNDRSPATDNARDAGGYRGAGSPMSPRQSNAVERHEDEDEKQGILRRETTNKGRRKSTKRGGPSNNTSGEDFTRSSSTAVESEYGRPYPGAAGASGNGGPGPAVPQIGVTGPRGGGVEEYMQRDDLSDEDWYGDLQQRASNRSYQPSNPQMGTWRGT